MFEFFTENTRYQIIKQVLHQVIQLLSITHEIYQTFDDNFEVKAIFQTYPKHLIKAGAKVLHAN